jgi:hypothetical protein
MPLKMSGLRSLRPKFRVIHLAPVLAILALMGWALASPVGSSPDDNFHLASIWCAAGEQPNQCHIVAGQSVRAVPEPLIKMTCFARYPRQSAACQGALFNNPNSHLVSTTRGNWVGLYPPVYYLTMSHLVSSSIQISAILMRVANILLLVVLTTVLYVLLPAIRRTSLVWGLALSLVPLGLFLVASNNPSAWAVISAGILWISLVGYFESSGAKKAGLGIMAALATVIGTGARADSAIYALVAIVVAVVMTGVLQRRWLISALLPVALAVTASVFYFSTSQSLAAISGLPGYASKVPTHDRRYLAFMDFFGVPSLWSGVFGTWKLGWIDTPMPAIVWVGSLGCAAAMVFLGLASVSARKVLATMLVLSIMWLLPTYILVTSGAQVGEGVQPRYILPLVTILVGVVLWQVGKERLRLSTGQVVALVSTLSVANAFALHFDMRRYITGTTIVGWNLNSGIRWWWSIPVSPMAVWAAGSLSFAAFLVIVARETLLVGPADAPHDQHDSGAEVLPPDERDTPVVQDPPRLSTA